MQVDVILVISALSEQELGHRLIHGEAGAVEMTHHKEDFRKTLMEALSVEPILVRVVKMFEEVYP